MIIGDLHNHTTFSDGENSIEDMIRSAISAGLKVIGISDHSFTDFDPSYCMKPNDYEPYVDSIKVLKEKYQDQIKVLAGIEYDYCSYIVPNGLDYIIGSVHYLDVGEKWVPVDLSRQDFEIVLWKYFAGDPFAMCSLYYETLADIIDKTDCDIIGHFDLIAKFNAGNYFFDEESDTYRKLWQKCALKLLDYNRFFEVNYGTFTKGYRNEPYLKKEMRDFILERGGKLVYSSDSHSIRRYNDLEKIAGLEAESHK